MRTLNEVYSSLASRRRYEVWFVRLGLADGGGAWWFRYLLMNPGRHGCSGNPIGMPVQIWATWFPRDGRPQSFIQGFPLQGLELSAREQRPFHFCSGENAIDEDACRGRLEIDGHNISWNIRYVSTFHVTLSTKGWIGFSRTPHSDAVFSGRVTLDGRSFEGDPLGFGLQGHNCGYRHRGSWTWAHACFPQPEKPPSTLEALVYEMPLGLVFRKAVLWHAGQQYLFSNIRDLPGAPAHFGWHFIGSSKNGLKLDATFDGSGPSIHRLPYLRTNCSGSFEVTNNSLAKAIVRLQQRGTPIAQFETFRGAVLEKTGRRD
jgi:hypothetical protein